MKNFTNRGEAKNIYTNTDKPAGAPRIPENIQEKSNTLYENILLKGSKFCKHKKWSHQISVRICTRISTNQVILVSNNKGKFRSICKRPNLASHFAIYLGLVTEKYLQDPCLRGQPASC
jgi:hypothetical protein